MKERHPRVTGRIKVWKESRPPTLPPWVVHVQLDGGREYETHFFTSHADAVAYAHKLTREGR